MGYDYDMEDAILNSHSDYKIKKCIKSLKHNINPKNNFSQVPELGKMLYAHITYHFK